MDADAAADAFARLYSEVYRQFGRQLEPGEYRLPPESIAILQHLADAGPLTVGEAARHLARSQAATSEQIARLCERGLLDRMPDERDRRRVLTWLTDDGRRELQRARQVLSEPWLAQAFERLSATERQRLIEGLTVLVETKPSEGVDDE